MSRSSSTTRARLVLREFSGACGDLGTFIPQVIGAITVAGLAPAGVLFGFAAFLIADDCRVSQLAARQEPGCSMGCP